MKCPDNFATCMQRDKPVLIHPILLSPRKKRERHRAPGAVSVRRLIETLVPAFCFQTAQEIMECLELIDDTIEKWLVARVIFDLVASGRMVKRIIKTPRFPGQADGKRRGPKGLYEYRMADFSPEHREVVRKVYA